MDRPWEAFDRARRVLRGRDDLAGGKSADLPSVFGKGVGESLWGAANVLQNKLTRARYLDRCGVT